MLSIAHSRRGGAVLLVLVLACCALQARAEQNAARRVDQAPEASAATAHARDLLSSGDAQGARREFQRLAQRGDAEAQDALAAMWLEGIGGAADRGIAMAWFCRLAHQREGGRAVIRALWFLAEYFRTGGGLPGRRYTQGTRELQNPVKAYFWYQVMVRHAELYDVTYDEAGTLGRLGSASAARELSEDEKEQVRQQALRWSPSERVSSAQACLNLPQR